MGYAILKDLLIHGESGVELLKEIRPFVVKRKEDILDYVVRNADIDELILVNPFGEKAFPFKVEAVLKRLEGLKKVVIVNGGEIVESVELPSNVHLSDDYDISEDFSSSPINNVPKIYIEGVGITEVEIPSLWIVEVGDEVQTPVSYVKDMIDRMRSFDNLVVILTTYLLEEEYKAISTLVKETGGFTIDYHDYLIEPKDEIETEFMMKMKDRAGKYLGMKILRGEDI